MSFFATNSAFGVTNSATSAGCTLESLKETMEKIRALMPPKSEQATALRMNSTMIEALKQQADYQPTTLQTNSLYGVPIITDERLHDGAFVSERADGSEVVHFNGEKIRRLCLRAEFDASFPFRWKPSVGSTQLG